jgi:hypothetical protein
MGSIASAKEGEMASMFIKQRVADYAKWKPVFDEHETMRRAGGVTAHSVHRQPDDPNIVIVALRVSDVNKARQFAGSDDLKAVMARAGVQGPPEIWFADDVEEKRY